MNILAFDTSTDCLSVGIYGAGGALAEYHQASFTKHSDIFFTVLDGLLKQSGLPLSAVKTLAVGLGPGSFTGLRVGLMAAKVMAYANAMRIVAVPSPEIAAAGVEAFDGPVAVIADAKKGNIYCSIYQGGNFRKVIQKPALMTLKTLLNTLRQPTFFVVDDWDRYAYEILKQKKGCFAGMVEGALSFPKASRLAVIAADRIRRKSFTDPFKLKPLYLYPRDCNVILKKVRTA
jgi:tRNA threonylcarbamoyladenosine biosynthesis protein TsaB